MSARDQGGGPGAVWQFVLVVAALEAFAWAWFWGTQPDELFWRLGMRGRNDTWAWQLPVPRGKPPDHIPAPRDAGLWHLLALLPLAQAAFLALAAWRPRSLGGLAVVPLIGHALGAALWLWALGALSTVPPERVPFAAEARGPLLALAAHDAVWLPPLLIFLLVWRRRGRDGKETTARVQ